MKKLSKILAVALCLVMAVSLLTFGASAAEEKSVNFTVDSLGLESQKYTAGTNTVDGVAVEWIQLGNYGDGIQCRDKNGNTSMFWNTSAFAGGITKIELTYSSTKDVTYSNPDAVVFSFGNEVKGADYSTKLSTEAGVKTYTITPDANTYTYFYMEHDLGYSFYWDSIKVYYAEADEIDPPAGGDDVNPPAGGDDIEPPAQTGDFSIAGLALVAMAATAGLVVMKKKEN